MAVFKALSALAASTVVVMATFEAVFALPEPESATTRPAACCKFEHATKTRRWTQMTNPMQSRRTAAAVSQAYLGWLSR